MANNRRKEKYSGLIGNFVSTLFVTKIDDPRLRHLSITKVEVSIDLKHAKVFYSVLGSEKEINDAKIALKKASGFARFSIGKVLNLRNTPELHFIYDKNPAYAERINTLFSIENERMSEKQNTLDESLDKSSNGSYAPFGDLKFVEINEKTKEKNIEVSEEINTGNHMDNQREGL
jgi:ribosome-binding factor A